MPAPDTHTTEVEGHLLRILTEHQEVVRAHDDGSVSTSCAAEDCRWDYLMVPAEIGHEEYLRHLAEVLTGTDSLLIVPAAQATIGYGVVLDDCGSTDLWDTLAEAEANSTGTEEIVQTITVPFRAGLPCSTCNGRGVLGYPPDNFYDCPECVVPYRASATKEPTL